METKNILHMTKGDGEFSYAHNSNVQNRAFTHIIKPLIESVIISMLKSVDANKTSCEILSVADLGCGIGPTPISLISTITSSVQKKCTEMKWDNEEIPQIQIFMSDLISNDFNLLFKDVENVFQGQNGNLTCFVMAAPGSFYGRLFPRNTLHLVVSNYAIHWLSQVPKGLCNEIGRHINRGQIYASKRSDPQVLRAYYSQFQQDFTTFLNCRSLEVVSNCYMLLATFCRPSIEPMESRLFEFISKALACLVAKGAIEEDKLDAFNLPIYFPCKEEIDEIVTKEGSFAIDHLEVMQDNSTNNNNGVEDYNPRSKAEFLAKTGRSITESLVTSHFGDGIWDELYPLLYRVIFNTFELKMTSVDVFNIIIVLKKKV